MYALVCSGVEGGFGRGNGVNRCGVRITDRGGAEEGVTLPIGQSRKRLRSV